jgi:hypothetical protein
MTNSPYPRVFACPDDRIAVDLGFDRWLMVDRTGWMAVASGELTRQAVEMLPLEPGPVRDRALDEAAARAAENIRNRYGDHDLGLPDARSGPEVIY